VGDEALVTPKRGLIIEDKDCVSLKDMLGFLSLKLELAKWKHKDYSGGQYDR
jgi:hypothetical protein